MALLLFDGDLIKLKCIKQEISLCTIRALFDKKKNKKNQKTKNKTQQKNPNNNKKNQTTQLYSHEAEC